ncbi:hypothetical protein GA0115261_114791, partial [Streptomyces sp. OspMP-M43]
PPRLQGGATPLAGAGTDDPAPDGTRSGGTDAARPDTDEPGPGPDAERPAKES